METTLEAQPETLKMTGNWSAMARLLKYKFDQLTDADLRFEYGKEEELVLRLVSRLKKKREEVIKIIKKGQV